LDAKTSGDALQSEMRNIQCAEFNYRLRAS